MVNCRYRVALHSRTETRQPQTRSIDLFINASENVAVLRHIALNLLKQEKSCKLDIKRKQLKAGWNHDYLLEVLRN
ncbi:hypothetical protein BH18ACI2_BH18ACI2_08510 [soil metagenome]